MNLSAKSVTLWYLKLKVQFVECGNPIAKSTVTELFVHIITVMKILHIFIAHAQNGRISTTGLKSVS